MLKYALWEIMFRIRRRRHRRTESGGFGRSLPGLIHMWWKSNQLAVAVEISFLFTVYTICFLLLLLFSLAKSEGMFIIILGRNLSNLSWLDMFKAEHVYQSLKSKVFLQALILIVCLFQFLIINNSEMWLSRISILFFFLALFVLFPLLFVPKFLLSWITVGRNLTNTMDKYIK